MRKGAWETKEAMALVEECVETVSDLELKLLCSCITVPWTSLQDEGARVQVSPGINRADHGCNKIKFWLEIDPVPS